MIRNEQGPLPSGSLYFGPVGSDPEEFKPLDAISGVTVSVNRDDDTLYNDCGPITSMVTKTHYTFELQGIYPDVLQNLYGIQYDVPEQYAVRLELKQPWDGPKKPVYTLAKSWKKWHLEPIHYFQHLKALWKWRKEYKKWVKDGKPDLDLTYYIPRATIESAEKLW